MEPGPVVTWAMTDEETKTWGLGLLEAMLADDRQATADRATAFDPCAQNFAIALESLPRMTLVLLRDGLHMLDEASIVVPRSRADAPEYLWWFSRITAVAMNGDDETHSALVRQLLIRCDQLPVDAAAELMGRVVVELVRFMYFLVRSCVERAALSGGAL